MQNELEKCFLAAGVGYERLDGKVPHKKRWWVMD